MAQLNVTPTEPQGHCSRLSSHHPAALVLPWMLLRSPHCAAAWNPCLVMMRRQMCGGGNPVFTHVVIHYCLHTNYPRSHSLKHIHVKILVQISKLFYVFIPWYWTFPITFLKNLPSEHWFGGLHLVDEWRFLHDWGHLFICLNEGPSNMVNNQAIEML